MVMVTFGWSLVTLAALCYVQLQVLSIAQSAFHRATGARRGRFIGRRYLPDQSTSEATSTAKAPSGKGRIRVAAVS